MAFGLFSFFQGVFEKSPYFNTLCGYIDRARIRALVVSLDRRMDRKIDADTNLIHPR